MRSTDVDQILPNITWIFLRRSKTKSMTFGCFKTVSNTLIQCLIASDEINTFCVCGGFHKFSTKSQKSHKLLISSKAVGHRMRMFDPVLERPYFQSCKVAGTSLLCWVTFGQHLLTSLLTKISRNMSTSNTFEDVQFFGMSSYEKYFLGIRKYGSSAFERTINHVSTTSTVGSK